MFEEGKLEPANLVKLQEALGMFNTFLEGRQYAAGDSITVADHSLIATVSTMEDCGEDNGFSFKNRHFILIIHGRSTIHCETVLYSAHRKQLT